MILLMQTRNKANNNKIKVSFYIYAMHGFIEMKENCRTFNFYYFKINIERILEKIENLLSQNIKNDW